MADQQPIRPELVEFVTERLGELEYQAKEAQQHGDAEFNLAQQTAYQAALRAPDQQWHREQAARHIGSWHPAFVLQDIAAKRRIIERHQWIGDNDPRWRRLDEVEAGEQIEWTETLKLLAAPFSSHPDFRAEWGVE